MVLGEGLNTSPPAVLQNIVFFYLGPHSVLHGIQEKHDLQRVPVDMQVYPETVHYKYTECISKLISIDIKTCEIAKRRGESMFNHVLHIVW